MFTSLTLVSCTKYIAVDPIFNVYSMMLCYPDLKGLSTGKPNCNF